MTLEQHIEVTIERDGKIEFLPVCITVNGQKTWYRENALEVKVAESLLSARQEVEELKKPVGDHNVDKYYQDECADSRPESELVKAAISVIDEWNDDHIVARYGEGKDALIKLSDVLAQLKG